MKSCLTCLYSQRWLFTYGITSCRQNLVIPHNPYTTQVELTLSHAHFSSSSIVWPHYPKASITPSSYVHFDLPLPIFFPPILICKSFQQMYHCSSLPCVWITSVHPRGAFSIRLSLLVYLYYTIIPDIILPSNKHTHTHTPKLLFFWKQRTQHYYPFYTLIRTSLLSSYKNMKPRVTSWYIKIWKSDKFSLLSDSCTFKPDDTFAEKVCSQL